ncbi:MAG: hypothetical protein ACRC92_18940 [Peptostreptococcaceae bacterium]
MNKKFIKISLIICIPFLLIIGVAMMTLGPTKDSDAGWSSPEELVMEYKSYKEEKYDYVITMVIKNNTNNIATINDMNLSFNYQYGYKDEEEMWTSDKDFYFRGYEEGRHAENSRYGIDPHTEKDVVFRIPKAINLDETVFDLEKPEVDYNISLYKYRTSDSSLMFGVGSMGGSRTLGMKY